MAIGDVMSVPGCSDLYYVDTGMYEVEAYGSVYIYDTERPAVVDTGIGTHHDRLFDALSEVGIDREELDYILPTHAHLDHSGGAGFLAAEYPNATVLTHERGVRHLVDPTRLVEGTKAAVGEQWEFYVEPKPVPEDRIEGLEGGDEVALGDRTLEVIHAPGHAPHQVMFHDRRDDVLFTADAAGIWVPAVESLRPTSPPPQFDLEQCLDDVRRIEEMAPEVLCFGHFGPVEYDPDLMAEYKRVLVEWVEAVREKRSELGDDGAVIEHFVEHTQMSDVWGRRKSRGEERLNVRGALAYLDRVESDEG